MMLILHEMARIKKRIHTCPEEYETHVKDIQAIEDEYTKWLPSKRFIDDLIMYAFKSYVKRTKSRA